MHPKFFGILFLIFLFNNFMDHFFDNLRRKLEETVDGSDFLRKTIKIFTPNASEVEQQSEQCQSTSGSNYRGGGLSQQTQQSTSDIVEINIADPSSHTNGQLNPDNNGLFQITSDTHSSDTSSIGNTSYGVSSLHTLNGSEITEPIEPTQKDIEWLAACKIFHEEELAQEIDRKNAKNNTLLTHCYLKWIVEALEEEVPACRATLSQTIRSFTILVMMCSTTSGLMREDDSEDPIHGYLRMISLIISTMVEDSGMSHRSFVPHCHDEAH
ncbi:hypothetical protein DdX_04062 [Ditylenchus destructor]|uniref:Uncharacterized protein n=1 Tax=Ditylenchus destructor TaxID=166010 RepID=A0AAD4NGE7_9BILA|nr:hypothetical protein DdX_04062 [Ditylenchus destructor]